MKSAEKIDKAIYLLEIFAAEKFTLDIKKFDGIIFPGGYYYYVGSAQKNFTHRIKRHISKTKIVHWHIDHITTIITNNIRRIFVLENADKSYEEKIANVFSERFNGEVVAKNFGNSDSTNTVTHLFYRKTKISYNQLTSLYHSMVRFIPSSIDTS